MGYTVIHKKEILLNREKLDSILGAKSRGYIELYNETTKRYGLNLSYKGFMHLLANRVTWKLTYAWAVSRTLGVNIEDIFEEVEINVEEKVREKEEWKKKYEKGKNSSFPKDPTS